MADSDIPSLEQLEFLHSLLGSYDGGIHNSDSSGLSFILYMAHCDGKLPDVELLDHLLERDDITRIEKIEALEMGCG